MYRRSVTHGELLFTLYMSASELGHLKLSKTAECGKEDANPIPFCATVIKTTFNDDENSS